MYRKIILLLVSLFMLACEITTVIPVIVDTHTPSARTVQTRHLAKPPASPAVLDAGRKETIEP